MATFAVNHIDSSIPAVANPLDLIGFDQDAFFAGFRTAPVDVFPGVFVRWRTATNQKVFR